MNIEIKTDTKVTTNRTLPPLTSTAYEQKKKQIIAIVVLQVALMLGTVVPPAMTLAKGKTVVLKTLPVDPYDMFRGDYVHLNYEISGVNQPSDIKSGDDVYVTLHQSGQYWQAIKAAKNKPQLTNGDVCIKGRSNYGSIHLGIEQVFVPEKSGRDAERAKSLTVYAAVDDSGRAVIKKVMNGGRELYDSNRIIFGR